MIVLVVNKEDYFSTNLRGLGALYTNKNQAKQLISGLCFY